MSNSDDEGNDGVCRAFLVIQHSATLASALSFVTRSRGRLHHWHTAADVCRSFMVIKRPLTKSRPCHKRERLWVTTGPDSWALFGLLRHYINCDELWAHSKRIQALSKSDQAGAMSMAHPVLDRKLR